MSKLFVPEYWPFYQTKEYRRFDYTDATGVLEPITSVFSYDPKTSSMIYSDFNGKGEWQDDWYLQYRTGFGLAEWRDDLLQKNSTLRFFFGEKSIAIYSEPIGWGDYVEIGTVYSNRPKYDTLKSRPPQILTGFQAVSFEKLHDSFALRDGTSYTNVLQMSYAQTWNKNTYGARYYMAKGVGPIAIEWIGWKDGAPVYTSPRIDAVVSKY